MSYYNTLTEDIARAKEILEKGKGRAEDKPEWMTDHQWQQVASGGGTIYGADTYPAYKLLESFVEVIEHIGVKVCELAVRQGKRGVACPEFRPDHNGECLNCDEWMDAHSAEAIAAGERRARETE